MGKLIKLRSNKSVVKTLCKLVASLKTDVENMQGELDSLQNQRNMQRNSSNVRDLYVTIKSKNTDASVICNDVLTIIRRCLDELPSTFCLNQIKRLMSGKIHYGAIMMFL